ncbi:MAG TPA: hypothetical protein VM073_09365 [Usitatibacter sp.]|nr:hypothetical protein [Usitatibacter sp.]
MSTNDLALLAVIATPVAILVTINLALWLVGERGTLLFPFPGTAG